jgi:8-oxo-dGTP diphosphatase
MAPQGPAVGIGVFCIRKSDSRFVIGQRKGSLGSGIFMNHSHLLRLALIDAGTYALAGGHLEMFETFAQCAQREVKEETGLDIAKVHCVGSTESIFKTEGKHYVTIFMAAWVDDDAKAEVRRRWTTASRFQL